MQKRAKDLGMSLAKYQDTDEGHNANQSLVRVRFYEQQAQCAVGDGHAEFNAVRKEVRSAVSMNYDAPSASTADAPVRGTASWNAEVERTMKDRNCSRDEAISILHRKEKLQKNMQW